MILITGGTGYIGAHTCIELLNSHEDVLLIDNFINSKKETLTRIQKICQKSVKFFEGDIRDYTFLKRIFNNFPIDSVIHFAGLKSVEESFQKPDLYHENNVVGTLNLIKIMEESHCKKLIFSSSATVYGDARFLPITEEHPVSALNPYGQTKLSVENCLKEKITSDDTWSIINLRYFNPAGAHPSGDIGEDPKNSPSNLIPLISKVATGTIPELTIFGGDYSTPDGTGVRDYIHITDLAHGHLKALQYAKAKKGLKTLNLGTGKGYSVLEVLRKFEKVSKRRIPFEIVERRTGDSAESYADPSAANSLLNWQAKLSLKQMCMDEWRWKTKNLKVHDGC